MTIETASPANFAHRTQVTQLKGISPEGVRMDRARRVETAAGLLNAAAKALFTVVDSDARDDEGMLEFEIPKALEMLRRVSAELTPSNGGPLSRPEGALTSLLHAFTCVSCGRRLARDSDGGRPCLNPACDQFDDPTDNWRDVDA